MRADSEGRTSGSLCAMAGAGAGLHGLASGRHVATGWHDMATGAHGMANDGHSMANDGHVIPSGRRRGGIRAARRHATAASRGATPGVTPLARGPVTA